jgi:hypothetical protein
VARTRVFKTHNASSILATPTYLTGEVAERFIAPDSKSGSLSPQAQEFESPPLRSDYSIAHGESLSSSKPN